MAYVTINGKLVKVTHRTHFTRHGRKHVSNISQITAENHASVEKAKLKGVRHGNCNVTACQKPGATWWNTSTRKWYCPHCAYEINRWSKHDEGYEICFPSEEAAEAAKAKFTLTAQADWG